MDAATSIGMSHRPRARRLLFLVPFPPRLDAVHGGSRTIAQLLWALAERHRLAVLTLRGSDDPPVEPALRAACELVEEVPRADGRAGLALLGGRPRWVAHWASPAFAAKVRELGASWSPEIVQIEYHVMGQYLDALSGCRAPRVLVEHDPGAAAARDRHQATRGLARLASRLEVRAWERYERAILQEVDSVVVFTERDARAVAAMAGAVPIVRIPIAVALPERPLDPLGSPEPSICFVGSFIHPPNVDAALRLVERIFPPLQQSFPELVLHVVGDSPPAAVRRLADARVIVTGRVPDTTAYLDRASVVVVPLRLGGGMRVKVLEALAAGKALVASPLAVEGLDVADGEQVVLAERDSDFSEAVGELLRDPTRRAALATSARAWACTHLGREPIVDAYEQLYDSLSPR